MIIAWDLGIFYLVFVKLLNKKYGAFMKKSILLLCTILIVIPSLDFAKPKSIKKVVPQAEIQKPVEQVKSFDYTKHIPFKIGMTQFEAKKVCNDYSFPKDEYQFATSNLYFKKFPNIMDAVVKSVLVSFVSDTIHTISIYFNDPLDLLRIKNSIAKSLRTIFNEDSSMVYFFKEQALVMSINCDSKDNSYSWMISKNY
jgi:hypothetical protein